jgi:tetratricopeptide (TPR) repeat protein/tRNA A-37 threonylcarbamoyl transferase component Bud32
VAAPPDASAEPLEVDVSGGATIGRYVVLYRHGRGGMGHVYAAYDPELDRKVAIKLLRHVGTSKRQKRARARLMREAQALARLSHPNVVSIHDVGLHDGRVFVAMEFLEGLTLRRWTEVETHHWKDVVKVFSQAGRGLAAAHEAGLVHRDFKPDNAIVGSDGRVVVLDFGLARFGLDRSPEEAEPASDEDAVIDLEVAAMSPLAPLTRDGALVGTPAYMGPEQLRGSPADQRSDQFAFCVALYEAVYGEHPFVLDESEDLERAVLRGIVREAPRTRNVPGWIRTVLLRGLNADPKSRFPTMDHLLTALSRDPWKRRRRIGLIAVGTAAVAGLAYFGGRHLAREQNRCDGAAEILEGVYSDSSKARAEAAFVATDKPYAAAAWHTTAEKLDAYAQSWTTARTAVCEATWVDEDASEEVLLLRLGCLQDRLDAFASLVGLFESADATVVERAVVAVHGLEPVAPCQEIDSADPTEETRSDVERDELARLRRELARAEALAYAGKYVDGLDVVDRVVAEAQDFGDHRLQADALFVQGTLRQRNGETDAAEQSLRDAVFTAEAANAMDAAARAWIELLDIARLKPQLAEEATQWERHASSLINRLDEGSDLEARLYYNLANLRYAQGRYDDAISFHKRALELREAVFGPKHVKVGESLRGLGTAYEAAGRFDEAVDQQRRAQMVLESLLGPNHPEVARVLTDLAIAYDDQGQRDKARPLYERAIAVFEKAHGPDHPQVAAALNNLAGCFYQDSEFDKAGVLFSRALTIYETTYGPEHPDVALTLGNLGLVAEGQQRFQEAIIYHQRALALREEILGVEHPDVAVSLRNLGDLYQYLERYEEALTHHERAVAILEKALGPGHPRVATVLLGEGIDHERLGHAERALELYHAALRIREHTLAADHVDVAEASSRLGLAWLELGAPEQARQYLERALDIYEASAIGFSERGRTRFGLARLLGSGTAEERARAAELARGALEDYRSDPFGYPAETREVRRWLKARTGGPADEHPSDNDGNP